MHIHISSWHLILGKELPVPMEQEGVWHPELIWMFWRREKPLVPSGIGAPDSSSCSLDTILSMLLQLLMYIAICLLMGIQCDFLGLYVSDLVGKHQAQIPAPMSTGRLILQASACYL